MNRRHWLAFSSSAALGTLLSSCGGKKLDPAQHEEAIKAVILQHADICTSAFRNAWQKGDLLRSRVDLFFRGPTQANYTAIRDAWTDAFLAYARTEALRATGTPSDALHTRLQSWPLDPAQIDSVPGKLRTGLVHSTQSFGEPTLAAAHQPRDGRIVLGYHPIECLLFGDDSFDDGPGHRMFLDYTRTPGHARRGQLLKVLTQILVADLKKLADAWTTGRDNYRSQFIAQPPQNALATIFNGLRQATGTALGGKLARPLESGDQKDEVCNQSDTTHQAISEALLGIQDTLTGNAPGRTPEGSEKPLLDLIALAQPKLAQSLRSEVTATLSEWQALTDPFDQRIKKNNNEGRAAIQRTIDRLEKQESLLNKAAKALGADPVAVA